MRTTNIAGILALMLFGTVALAGTDVSDGGFMLPGWDAPLAADTWYMIAPIRLRQNPTVTSPFELTHDSLRVQVTGSRNHFFHVKWDHGSGWIYRTEFKREIAVKTSIADTSEIHIPDRSDPVVDDFQEGDEFATGPFRCYEDADLFSNHQLIAGGTKITIGSGRKDGFVQLTLPDGTTGWGYHTELHKQEGDSK